MEDKLVYITGKGKVYLCENISECATKTLYHYKNMSSNIPVYGKYQQMRRLVPNEQYIKFIAQINTANDLIKNINLSDDLLFYSIGMRVFAYSLDKKVYNIAGLNVTSLVQDGNIITSLRIYRNILYIAYKSNGRSRLITYSYSDNTFTKCGKSDYKQWAILPNGNVVILDENSFIKIYDIGLQFLSVAGKRLYQTGECKLIVSSDSHIYTLEKDKNGISILTRH